LLRQRYLVFDHDLGTLVDVATSVRVTLATLVDCDEVKACVGELFPKIGISPRIIAESGHKLDGGLCLTDSRLVSVRLQMDLFFWVLCIGDLQADWVHLRELYCCKVGKFSTGDHFFWA